jgi:outer membrane protein insertion porin family
MWAHGTFRTLLTTCLLCLGAAAAPSLGQQAPTPPDAPEGEDPCDRIHAIEVRGNERMSPDAVRFDLQIRRGDPWDPQRIRREFRRAWNRGYFSDLRFFKRCEPEGAVLVVEIDERRRILSVEYEDVSGVNRQQIEDFYNEQDFVLRIGTPLDRRKLFRAESMIRQLLGQKGYLDAEVAAEVEEVGQSAAEIFFSIDPGGKTKIRELDFVGNTEFSDGELRDELELIREWHWWWPFGSKTLYHPMKYQQDINNVLSYYRDHGYLDVDVSPPVVEVKTTEAEREDERSEDGAGAEETEQAADEPAELSAELREASEDEEQEEAEDEDEDEERKWVYITIPIEEGPRYRLGEIRIEGNTLFEDDLLRRVIPLTPGSVLSDRAIESGLETIRQIYGRRGYIYAVASRRFERREGDEPVADVVVEIDEDQAYRLGRLEFHGNTSTHDVVLRREMNVHEGEILDKAQLDRSMQKLQNLGFWLPSEEPALTPDVEEAEVDVDVYGEEQSRNEIQVGGGYSELEGGFFLGSFRTQNFLGRGETLNLYAAVGGQSNRAQISFVEPWFMGEPYTFGFTISRQSLDFGRVRDATGAVSNLNQTSTGGSILVGRRIGDFSRFQLRYQYQSITADTIDLSSTFASTETRLASIIPSFNLNRVNNPLRPTRGYQLDLFTEIAADWLGGDVSFIKPRLEGSWYQPLNPKLFLGLHAEVGWIEQFGDLVRRPGFVAGVPRFERFFLGGDRIGPRGFETRSLSPLRFIVPVDENGNPQVDPTTGIVTPVPAFVGGSKFGLIQLELGIPVGKTATFAGFLDAGGIYDNGDKWDGSELRVSAGLEFRVFLPVFQAPIRLIYAWPLEEQPGDQTSRFQFSIGLPF